MYSRVVVPLDGSSLAEGILPFILQIAGPLDMTVLLVRVVQPATADALEESRHVVLEDVEGRLLQARSYLEPLAQALIDKGVKCGVAVRHGSPAAEIVAAAQDHRADLIAMTTHGRSGLGRLVFGSVAEAVLRTAGIPVFLMRLTALRPDGTFLAPASP